MHHRLILPSHQKQSGKVLALLFFLLACSTISAKELIISTSKSIPPYIINETESGLQIDRVRKAFQLAGYHIQKIIFTSNKRAEQLLLEHKVDAIINAPPIPNIYLSEPVVYFHNVAVTLVSSNITLRNLSDLRSHRIMAFQNAIKFLGEEYRQLMASHLRYDEAVNQNAQLRRLFSGQIDVIILDKRIFEYYHQQLIEQDRHTQPVKFHYLFEPAPRRLGFYNQTLRNEFNGGLSQLNQAENRPQMNNNVQKIHPK
ncbi:transporter substrate-binding domain-containing protein [Litoribacillus peritrichatus]|uniref:Transporter substrate-binding domain-containing protein n=1 Tax=Litoribacillus peritrichatus TaxID=718191 RepID=A0ABP7NF05_9GAMM